MAVSGTVSQPDFGQSSQVYGASESVEIVEALSPDSECMETSWQENMRRTYIHTVDLHRWCFRNKSVAESHLWLLYAIKPDIEYPHMYDIALCLR
jgi:hypothetical protein